MPLTRNHSRLRDQLRESFPTDGLVGTCSYTASQSVTEESLQIRFYSEGWTAAEGAAFCDSASGVWAAE